MNIIKRAARTVIVDNEDRIVILDVNNGDYYKIPGGGVEEGETDEEAAKREALEESGCEVELIQKIGEQQFVDPDPNNNGRIHFSVCYLAKKKTDGQTNFNDWEKENSFKMKWVTFDEAINLFEKVSTLDQFGVEINKRDLDFIKIAREILKR